MFWGWRKIVNTILESVNEDGYNQSSRTIVPFQIAYEVSIHKAQVLEYNSVKRVITNEVEELVPHNIFYTAITIARKKWGFIGLHRLNKKF